MHIDQKDYEMHNGVWHHFYIKHAPAASSEIRFTDNGLFRYDDSPPVPDARIHEYLFVRDRFHDRSYTDDAGKTYTTKVVIKKLSEVEGFDPAAAGPDWVSDWDAGVRYPVVQLFEGDGMIFEERIDHYSEGVASADNGSYRTNVQFSAHTLKDGLYVELDYGSYYYTRFQIRGLDFANPDPGERFSTKYTRSIKTVDDYKEGGKKTVSYATP